MLALFFPGMPVACLSRLNIIVCFSLFRVRMDEGEKSKNIWPKEKTEASSDLFTGDTATGSLDVVNVTSLADIFDTAFTSTADPASHPRYPSGSTVFKIHNICNRVLFLKK